MYVYTHIKYMCVIRGCLFFTSLTLDLDLVQNYLWRFHSLYKLFTHIVLLCFYVSIKGVNITSVRWSPRFL